MTLKWRNQWDEKADAVERATTEIDFTGDPGKTIQEPTEDADINVLVKRFGIVDGSQLPRWADPKALYGDVSEFPQDPTEVANIMRDAEVRFLTLPADIRERFNNPGRLYKWLEDSKNDDEAVRIGLLKPILPDGAPGATAVSPSTSSVKETTSATAATAAKP